MQTVSVCGASLHRFDLVLAHDNGLFADSKYRLCVLSYVDTL